MVSLPSNHLRVMDEATGDSTTIPFLDDGLPVDENKCRLFGPTALVVQALMGVFVILSLVYKRHREKPKRPWKIWSFDISKQIAGQMFLHGLNVLISDLGAHHAAGNPCSVYILNILVDTTFGVGLIYLVHHFLTYVISDKYHLKGFASGHYGEPPSFWYWIRQAAVYFLSLTVMKVTVVGLFAIWPGIFKIGDWLLSWTKGRDYVQVIFVMGIIPIVMNVLQFWLIDSIVKASAYALTSESSPRHSVDYEPLFQGPEDDDGESNIQPRRHDIENPAPSSSRAHSISTSVEEHKTLSSRASTKTLEEENGNLPSSATSTCPGSAVGTPRRRTSSNHSPIPKRKRSPPPPLDLTNAVDSADVSGARVIAVSGTPMTGRKESTDSGNVLSLVSEKLSAKNGQVGRNNSPIQ